MLRFTPPTLEDAIRNALRTLGADGSVEFKDSALYEDFAPEDLPDAEITEASLVEVGIVRCDDPVELTAGEFVQLMQEVSAAKDTTFDGLTYHSQRRTIISVQPADARTAVVLDSFAAGPNQHAVSVIALDGQEIAVGLVRTSVHFGLTLVLRGYFYDKYYPPLTGDDAFVEVRHPTNISASKATDIVYAYLFELNSSLGLRFSLAPRPDSQDESPESDEVESVIARAERLRPILVGAGLGPLMREFHRGTAGVDDESSLICLVKCIEYVSATVVRERQYDDIRKRLQSPFVLSPTAAYMDDLLALFEENRIFTKDHEALKLTVDRCCDAILLSQHAPKCIPSLRSITANSKNADRRAGLAELSACLSATRNQLAHAKANYELTGKECPPDQLSQLLQCARIAAEQCVRWYAMQNPDLRRA